MNADSEHGMRSARADRPNGPTTGGIAAGGDVAGGGAADRATGRPAGAAPERAKRLRRRIGAGGQDRWTRWARPGLLWVAYALLLWAVPVGLVAAVDPARAGAMAAAMRAYWEAIPESLFALMGTGFLGYAAARSVEKVAR